MSKYLIKDFLFFVAVRRLHTQVRQVETVTTSFQAQTSRQRSLLRGCAANMLVSCLQMLKHPEQWSLAWQFV